MSLIDQNEVFASMDKLDGADRGCNDPIGSATCEKCNAEFFMYRSIVSLTWSNDQGPSFRQRLLDRLDSDHAQDVKHESNIYLNRP
jgi:hypothetical protein